MKRFNYLIFILLVFCFACTGDQVEKNAYRALSVMSATYDGIMLSAGDAYKNKLITEDQRNKIVDVGNVFYGTFHTANSALASYIKVRDEGGNVDKAQGDMVLAVNLALEAMMNFTAYYNDVASGIEGMKKWEEKK